LAQFGCRARRSSLTLHRSDQVVHMALVCSECGARFQSTIPEEDDFWHRPREVLCPDYQSWLKQQQLRVSAEIQELARVHAGADCQGRIMLSGPAKDFVLAGKCHSPKPLAMPEGARIDVFYEGKLGKLCYEGVSERNVILPQKHQQTNEHRQMQVMNPNDLFSGLSSEEYQQQRQKRLHERVESALQEVWQEFTQRYQEPNMTLKDVAERILKKFPDVKVKQDRRRHVQQNTWVLHGIKAVAIQKFIWDELEKDLEPLRNTAVAHEAVFSKPESKHVQVKLLTFNRHPPELHQVLSESILAKEALSKGLDIRPSWAKGAMVFVSLSQPAVPLLGLRPWHVIIAAEDEDKVRQCLQASMAYKQRPRPKEVKPMQLHAGGQPSWDFEVENTFINVLDQDLSIRLEPSVPCIKSMNDQDELHTNPRSLCLSPSSCTPMAKHIQRMKCCQQQSDLPGALQAYSNLRADGLEPDITVFNILINTSLKDREPQRAHDLFHEMKSQWGIVPNEITFNLMLRGFACSGSGKKAEKWFGWAIDCGMQPTARMRQYVQEAYEKAGYHSKAKKWQSKMMSLSQECNGRGLS